MCWFIILLQALAMGLCLSVIFISIHVYFAHILFNSHTILYRYTQKKKQKKNLSLSINIASFLTGYPMFILSYLIDCDSMQSGVPSERL